jgi:hypothetical protein
MGVERSGIDAFSLRALARALGGEIAGRQVLAPGPGHGPRDRSLSVRLSAIDPDGFVTHSFAGDDFRDCRAHVLARLGLTAAPYRRDRQAPKPRPTPSLDDQTRRCDRFQFPRDAAERILDDGFDGVVRHLDSTGV